MPDKHAILSASGAARWLACTPSARLEQKFPNTSSEYAKEGTLAHTVAELTARYFLGEISELQYENLLNKLAKSEDGQKFYNAEMREHAVTYAELIQEKLKEERLISEDAFCELEVRLDFSAWVPAAFGTGDCVIIADDWLEIIDLKYGKGYRVEAEGNPQMRLYALGALQKYGDLFDINNIRMTIFQPRLIGGTSSDEISVEELLKWADEYVRPRALLADKGEGEYAPSEETCKFCRAKAQCLARYEKNLQLFEENSPADLITVEDAGEVLKQAKDIKAWLEDLEGLVFNAIKDGQEVDGWKIVEGRSIRQLTDEQGIVKTMTEAGYNEALLYERKLLTITQFEANFGKKTVQELLGKYIVKPQGKPTLAPASDKRKAWNPEEQILKAFDD